MSAPIKVTQEQYDRWVEHLEGAGKCRRHTSPKFMNPEKEERIVKAWRKHKGTIQATCRDVKVSASTVRTVLRKRGLIL